MKTLGMIGGTGWVSSVDYYRLINQGVNDRLGGLQAAKCILYSINYAEIDALNIDKNLEGVYLLIKDAAEKLKRCDIDGLMLCANTTHMFATRLVDEIGLPIVHIGEATAGAIRKQGLTRVALLGTRFTMERDFYRDKLNEQGIEMMVPDKIDRAFVHRSILNELLKNDFREETRKRFLQIIDGLIQKGAEGVVLGCTEIPLLIKEEDVEVPVFNTTEIHASAAVDFVLGN